MIPGSRIVMKSKNLPSITDIRLLGSKAVIATDEIRAWVVFRRALRGITQSKIAGE
jgi:hypothetical protein